MLNEDWRSGVFALQEALKLEANVTRSLRSIIAKCENTVFDSISQKKPNNDYHVNEIACIVMRVKIDISDLLYINGSSVWL